MDAAAARAKYGSKMASVNWGNASANWAAAKGIMKSGYTFGGKAKRNYDAAIDKASYRAPTSTDVARAVEKFNAATA